MSDPSPAPKKTQNDTAKSKKKVAADQFLIVGIGASAGGIQALKEFFSRVPKHGGMAYVVILHMSPEHESKLAEILQVTSEIPVNQVQGRVKVEPNQVYVIPPNQNLTMTDGHLDLASMIGSEERRSPIDLFFRTLAETNSTRAVSVILSGTGADGSMGLKRVKEHGGVVFAQDPQEAEYNDMPRNAIATGMVDHVLPVTEIPGKIHAFKDHVGTVQIHEHPTDLPKPDEALISIFTQLRVRTGHDFSNYKRATILRRIERRLGLLELSGLSKYAEHLREQPHEVHLLMKDLLISVTNFFRDSDSLEALSLKVISKFFENKTSDDPVRIWVAGCATGEEAYSIGMLLAEHIETKAIAPNVQVFATDIDERAIQIAREGYYSDAEVADVSPERLRKYFIREADGYRVRRELRESILFAVHNIIKDPPFSHLDLISCRNLLIYLNRTAQDRVLEVLHFALKPVGHLFLGGSESVEGASDLFSVIDREHHIYRSRPVPSRAFPIPDVSFKPQFAAIQREKTPEERRALERLSFADLHQRLLESYAPPSVIVNEDYDIVHLSDRAGIYLQIAGGQPSNNLLKLAREGLRLELRTALYQAVQEQTNVEARGLKVTTVEGLKTVNLSVRPVLRGDDDPSQGFILVIFEEAAQAEEAKSPAEVTKVAATSEPVAQRLEEELTQAKKHLRATVEQYEIQQEELQASNEELQAMNEELRSAAEELETSKEELQSLNEELTTVNQELKIKIEELSLASNNFLNLMNSTNIGTIFLDRSFRVRQFTPAARKTFNLIPSDIGRPLLDITSKVKIENLASQMEAVMNRLETVEQEVKSTTDRSYVMRLSPYRTLDDKIDGLVITLVDITERARAAEIVKQAGKDLEVKVSERTAELAFSNEALRVEIHERELSEDARGKLLEKLVNAQEGERRRLARDLHDQLGQQLTALRLKLDSLGQRNNLNADTTFGEIEDIVTQLDADVDFLAWEVRPIALDELGLETALANYTKQWSDHFHISGEFHSRGLGEQRLSPEIESNFYRIAQEALNNCAKHAECTRADIILECSDHQVALIIEDNGVGFDPQQAQSALAMGLLGMRERALLMGGTFEIESAHRKGTTIFVRVPLK
jgi:two-component system CheB/CheR fusion protein